MFNVPEEAVNTLFRATSGTRCACRRHGAQGRTKMDLPY